jgi:orotate phosphoribosyltransferase
LDWLAEFKEKGALWVHDGRTASPHALLTSGLHSDGYVNGTKIVEDPAFLQRAVDPPDGLASFVSGLRADWVIGSAMGAITLAFAVAHHLGAKAGYTEKDGEKMELKRFEVPSGATILLVEDVISTGGSTLKTVEGIRRATSSKVRFLPFLLSLVNRSGQDCLGDWEIRSLLALRVQTWAAQECPLCRQGSPALRPKGQWERLVQARGKV